MDRIYRQLAGSLDGQRCDFMIYCGKSDIGNKRDTNEDCFGSYVDDENNLSFFILADGMGGHNAGEVASLMAVEQFLNEAKRYKGSKTCNRPLWKINLRTGR